MRVSYTLVVHILEVKRDRCAIQYKLGIFHLLLCHLTSELIDGLF